MVRSHLPQKLEDEVSLTEAALVEPCAVGLAGVRKAEVDEKKSVLVVGGGIIGLMNAMWAKKFGAKNVILAESGENRIAFAKKCDFIDKVIDAKNEDCSEKLLEANGGEMYDIAFECVGIKATLNGYIDIIKSGGKLMLLGVPNEEIPFRFNPIVVRNISVIPSHAWTFEEFKEALKELTEGNINLKQFITDIKPFDEIQSVFENLTSGDTKDIKVLLRVSG